MRIFLVAQSVVIPANQQLPAERCRPYYTVSDYQTSIRWTVYEGDEEYAADNRSLGTFEMAVPAAKRGEVRAQVTFKVEGWNTLLTVTAQHGETSEVLQIERSNAGLDKATVDMLRQQLLKDWSCDTEAIEATPAKKVRFS